ncbi:MAG: hypothetical protein JNL63_03065, partial [Bacteroidia bacterium]|nr:hypothetical protein [Bacteroidia bacterium]
INSTNNYQNQGKVLTIYNLDVSLGYLVNPITNMQFLMGVNYRNDEFYAPTTFLYISFKTSLSNSYYDF